MRLAAVYVAILLAMLALFNGIIVYFAQQYLRELLQPVLGLTEGQSTYAAMLREVVQKLIMFDIPLVAVVGVAAIGLTRLSMQPLVQAREREARFIAETAHELRTPLATIAAIAQDALAAEGERRRESLATISLVALSASRLLSDMMLLMRSGPNAFRLYEPVDVAVLIAQELAFARERAPQLTIVTEMRTGEAYVNADAASLRRVFSNLLENALRYARTTLTVTVTVRQKAIECRVDNDGPAIVGADRERIFERYYKGDTQSPGSGLGLAIARRIVADHRGTFGLERDACFVVRLPGV